MAFYIGAFGGDQWNSVVDNCSLQRTIASIPMLKVLQYMSLGSALTVCSRPVINHIMTFLLIFIETYIRTLIATSFFLVANGWGVLRFDASPLETMSCMKFICTTFILHCALYTSEGTGDTHVYMRLAIVIYYAFTAFMVLKQAQKCQD